MATGLLGISWFGWGGLCLAVAALYWVAWPKPHPERREPRPAWAGVVLRWFHSLVWVLLALACALWGFQFPAPASWLGRFALLIYLVFLGVAVWDRRRNVGAADGD
jgi:hypothetical protein